MVSFREVSVAGEAAQTLLREYFADRAENFPTSMGTYRPAYAGSDAFQSPDGVFLIVEDVDLAGEPADVGCGGIRRVPSGVRGLVRFEVKHVWLQPHMRGLGIGHVLLAELERRAMDFGAQELVLDTHASLIAADRLYRSNGYIEIDAYNDNRNATTWFAKPL
jgi:GNAT superfamily N-acetyltransferase